MRSIFNLIVLCLALSLNITPIAAAVSFSKVEVDRGKEDFTKSEHKEFDISKSGEVVLSNKYGNIDVRTNDGSKVIVDVEIKVTAKNQDVADEVFDRISINFESSSDYVKTYTSIESNKGSWWGGGSKSSQFQINYKVSVPRTVEMDVSNKYGNVYITELDNDLDLDIKYGNFTVQKAADFDLEGKYGVGEIGSCDNIEADLGYFSGSGLEIGSCNEAEIDSKYSAIRIKKANSIDADAGYDNYRIGEVKSFRLDGNYNKINIDDVDDIVTDTRYTSVNIENLGNSADIELGYGGLDIYNVESGFEEITVEADYAGVKMRIASGASYKVNLDASYAGIEVPENTDIRVRDKSGNSKHIEGAVGSNPKGIIRVDSDYGSIRIK